MQTVRHASATLAALVLAVWMATTSAWCADDTLVSHLYDGTSKAGIEAAARVDPAQVNPDQRFALGVLKFVRSIEHLGQGLYRYGLMPPKRFALPIVRMPVPPNPSPDLLTYEGSRAILQSFVEDLKAADEALGAVGDASVRLPVNLGEIRLDLTGDGAKRDDERLWFIVMGATHTSPGAVGDDLTVMLDAGDVAWMRGYAHLMMAFSEWLLAHDYLLTFESSFGLLFPRVDSRDANPFRTETRGDYSGLIADAVTLIHSIRWPVQEATRMRAAQANLLQVIAFSRASWRAILARHDDDRHWIPAPGGRSVVALPVTREQIDAWFGLLDEWQAVLEGRKLVPYWRFHGGGINIAKVFDEPRPFDLVMWFTGPGAQPFFERGANLSTTTWTQTRAFGGYFLNYALWFN